MDVHTKTELMETLHDTSCVVSNDTSAPSLPVPTNTGGASRIALSSSAEPFIPTFMRNTTNNNRHATTSSECTQTEDGGLRMTGESEGAGGHVSHIDASESSVTHDRSRSQAGHVATGTNVSAGACDSALQGEQRPLPSSTASSHVVHDSANDDTPCMSLRWSTQDMWHQFLCGTTAEEVQVIIGMLPEDIQQQFDDHLRCIHTAAATPSSAVSSATGIEPSLSSSAAAAKSGEFGAVVGGRGSNGSRTTTTRRRPKRRGAGSNGTAVAAKAHAEGAASRKIMEAAQLTFSSLSVEQIAELEDMFAQVEGYGCRADDDTGGGSKTRDSGVVHVRSDVITSQDEGKRSVEASSLRRGDAANRPSSFSSSGNGRQVSEDDGNCLVLNDRTTAEGACGDLFAGCDDGVNSDEEEWLLEQMMAADAGLRHH